MRIHRRAITPNQKKAIKALIAGGNIVYLPDSIRVRDANFNPVTKLTDKGWMYLKSTLGILKKDKKGWWVVKRSAIIKMPARSAVKQWYKQDLKAKRLLKNKK